jgi:hypothetical protein
MRPDDRTNVEAALPTIRNEDVEALARQLLWDQIDRSAWHHGLSEEERTAAITADVEAWWHLRAGEAAQMLVDRAIAGQKSPRMTQDELSALSGPLPLPRSRNAA